MIRDRIYFSISNFFLSFFIVVAFEDIERIIAVILIDKSYVGEKHRGCDVICQMRITVKNICLL